MTLSSWSERRIAYFHHVRREKINRALFPLIFTAFIGVTVWALSVLPL